jgi:hypothetical protein
MKNKKYKVEGLSNGIKDLLTQVDGLVIRLEDIPFPLFIDKRTMERAVTYGDKVCFNYISSPKVARLLNNAEYSELVESENKYGQVDIEKR